MLNRSLWDDVADPPVPLLIVAGEKDKKFMEIARKMYSHSRLSVDRSEAKLERNIPGNGKQIGKVVDNVMESEETSFCNDVFRGHWIEKGHKFPVEELWTTHNDQRVEKEKRKFLLLVENTGHAVHLENPVTLVSGISNFLSKLQ